MGTPWDDDVAEAMRCAFAGRAENWPLVARTLAAEVSELRAKLVDRLVSELKRCPQCGDVADSVEVRASGPVRYRHGQLEHLGATV